MRRGRSLGREFGWLWASYTVGTVGTWFAHDAFRLVAILVLHSGTTQVAILSAAGPAAGALIAMPLGPWVEFHRKRPVMIAMDLVRFLALLSVPVAYALGGLGFAQLVVVSVIVASANIVFTAASGACLKSLVRPEDLLEANGRFEATRWTATAVGPPLGGAAVGMLGTRPAIAVAGVLILLTPFLLPRHGPACSHSAEADRRRAGGASPVGAHGRGGAGR